MKYCKQCRIHSRSHRKCCPLCSSVLVNQDDEMNDPFPKIETKTKQSRLVFRILFFISTVVSAISITVDMVLPDHPYFSIYVIIGLFCFWIGIILTVNRNQNAIKNITVQVFLISLIAIIWDLVTQWSGWSIEFVIPIVCINALISIAVIARILRYPITDYILYLLINIAFGISPVISLAMNTVQLIYPSLICVAGSIIALLAVLAFEGKNILDELTRRFHL